MPKMDLCLWSASTVTTSVNPASLQKASASAQGPARCSQHSQAGCTQHSPAGGAMRAPHGRLHVKAVVLVAPRLCGLHEREQRGREVLDGLACTCAWRGRQVSWGGRCARPACAAGKPGGPRWRRGGRDQPLYLEAPARRVAQRAAALAVQPGAPPPPQQPSSASPRPAHYAGCCR
jgi:hypothetical protein